jgi:serine/threonine protein phosphatase PrpC
MAQLFAASARTNVGLVRAGNEDSAVISQNLIAVADGMGGHAGGEVASALAIQGISRLHDLSHSSPDITEKFLQEVTHINHAIERAVIENPDLAGMGTTLTALIATAEKIALLHIGDTRCYRIRKNKITQLSTDHTLIQELLDQKAITENEIKTHPQRSLLTQALMGRDDLQPEIEVIDAKPGDRFLLCSDGLTGEIGEAELLTALVINDREIALDTLMKAVLAAGAPDNVTIIVADLVESDATDSLQFFGAAL